MFLFSVADCGWAGYVNGATGSGTTLAGDEYQFTYDPGYAWISGDLTRTCGEDGTWQGVLPECGKISKQSKIFKKVEHLSKDFY